MEKTKMTQKQLFVGGLLVKYYIENEKGLNAYQFIETFKNELVNEKIDIKQINSVNATLASLASKELATKQKVAFDSKMLTSYTPTKELVDMFDIEEDIDYDIDYTNEEDIEEDIEEDSEDTIDVDIELEENN